MNKSVKFYGAIRNAGVMIAAIAIIIITSNISFSQFVPKPGNLDKYDYPMLPSVVENTADYTVTKNNFWLTLRDNIKLDCSKFFPSEPNIYLPKGYPIVVMVHGYGDRKETLEQMATAQAAFNYVVYTYSVRGQGNSQGLSNLISYTEAEDLKEFVNYIKHDAVGGDTSKIIIMGGSQGGTLPYMAACKGMKVAGIISALSNPEFASSWIENGSVKMSFLWTIDYTPDTARYTPVVDRMSDWVYATGVKSNKWDSLAYWVPKDRDFKNLIGNNTVPMIIENSWQDYFFNTRQSISSFNSVNFPTRVYMGAVMGHGGDISDAENNWHMNFFNEFFYQYAFDQDQHFNTRLKYNYAYTTFPRNGDNWTFKHDSSAVWPPAGVETKKLYFHAGNNLEIFPHLIDNDKETFKNQVANGYTLQDAVYDEFTGSTFNNKFKRDSSYFDSNVLEQPVKMVGTPKIHLKYSSSADICQFNVELFEKKANGDVKFITRINYTDRNYTKNQVKTATIEGLSHAHIFSAGSKLRVVVTNLDRTKDDIKFLGTNPYVLPVMANGVNSIYLQDTWLELPVNMTGVGATGSWVTNLLGWLFQNYPNPFNPSTTIRFELPAEHSGLVTLKIYDMVGREVATLVNENMTAGMHEVKWDATKFASGVYFSKLIIGERTADIKRMLLIK